ncbi:MAG: OB-fold nucleic acid binding domain-containing protein [Desulfobacterales bacterium]|nr:OB-fold nucleic acid binding domain-containing protein [Desulfobacterales bacterium]MBL7101674.1 OB-fold nucleic acid binding domain-containing protein [Desulfobacteraceae bacterium]MBL7173861.1 OB-fold nucleic acid binding domain-containing protein [Desulfobacteraceae bacterium]
MRAILFFLILAAANGLFSPVSAEDLFAGRVLSVDRETGKLTVEIMDDGKTMDVIIPSELLPKSLLPGNVIRVWGEINQETGALDVTNMQALGQTGYGQDQTGVRRRIGKSSGQYGGRGGSKGRGR